MKVTIELAKIWSWIKSYWYVPLGFVIFGVLWYLTKSSDLSPWEMLQKARARVEQLLKKNKDNPAALAKRLSELTGLSFNQNDVE